MPAQLNILSSAISSRGRITPAMSLVIRVATPVYNLNLAISDEPIGYKNKVGNLGVRLKKITKDQFSFTGI